LSAAKSWRGKYSVQESIVKKSSVVVIGAGFSGLWAVRTLSRVPVDITLLDRNNYHTFLPLLYQVGAAEIEPEQIAYPIRSLLRKYSNIRYVRAEVSTLDFGEKYVLANNQRIDFDWCIVAAGSVTNYYGTPGSNIAFPLKTLDDSMILRNHILSCFERASYTGDRNRRRALLSFVVVGGGPTGIEFAGALVELINGPLLKDFPSFKRDDIAVVLVEASDRMLATLPPDLGEYTRRKLLRIGVDLRLSAPVSKIEQGGVTLADGTSLPSETVVWTAGVCGDMLVKQWKVPLSRDNRIRVADTLQITGLDYAYAVGDLAYCEQDGRPLPQIAPVAIQQGQHAAENIISQLAGKPQRPFRYRDRGTMVTIGRNAAVAYIARRSFKGFLAWAIWLGIHIMNLIGFRNKILVMINWAWDYFLFERAVRLILPRCCDSPSFGGCERRCGGE
jgi:NADH:ubiquinone reductase (H+-translocating)